MKNKVLFLFLLVLAGMFLNGCGNAYSDELVLRVCNWEEYLDEGDWDEPIILEDGTEIIGENDMISDFEEWYYETYGQKVRVEYSAFGTNEDLYNQMTLGDKFDLVCPSEYMIMKLLTEDALLPYSEEFYNKEIEENYYIRGLSPYIDGVFKELKIDEKHLYDYAAGYMWGTLGIVYNPNEISEEEASSWKLFTNPEYRKRLTVKDSVRDTYFAAISIYRADRLMDEDFIQSENYHEELRKMLNDVSPETLNEVEKIMSQMKENAYSFETDSGKSDIVSGKVLANIQWSGDGVYSIDQIEQEGLDLCFAVPKEAGNVWFDGWCMLKSGIGEDSEKQKAAEAFVNFISRPDNVVRNMDYIGYTSVIAGTDDRVFEYAKYSYEAEDDEEEVADYPLGYFFSESGDPEDEDYVITAPVEQLNRQLFSQYPTQEVLDRCVVMDYFGQEENKRINEMWINIRCFDLGF